MSEKDHADHVAALEALAQEIRRVNGSNSLGAGALAEALMPFIADLMQRQGWQPIETAPKDGSRMLIAGGTQSFGTDENVPFDGVSIAFWQGGYQPHWRGEDRQAHDDWYEHQPTHWQPLPAAPRAATEE
jgi:hypothetical protein